MDLKPVPFRSPLSAFEDQAVMLFAGHRAADPAAINLFHRKHPRFLDEKIKWRPKVIPDSEIRDAALSIDDARLTIARYYDFLDWPSLAVHIAAISEPGPVFEFEAATEAVINGDLAALKDALRRAPALSVRVPAGSAVSIRRCTAPRCSTTSRQTALKDTASARRPTLSKSPVPSLQAGAEPDALADMYGADCTTMTMLVSSRPPANAGLQGTTPIKLIVFSLRR